MLSLKHKFAYKHPAYLMERASRGKCCRVRLVEEVVESTFTKTF